MKRYIVTYLMYGNESSFNFESSLLFHAAWNTAMIKIGVDNGNAWDGLQGVCMVEDDIGVDLVPAPFLLDTGE